VKPPQLPAKLAEFMFDQVAMSHRFVVHLDHDEYDLGSWSRVSGLKVSWERHQYRAGDDNDVVVVPGDSSYPVVELARAACSDSVKVQRWLARTSRKHEPLSGGIHMLDFAGVPVITWELKQFFPVSWAISAFESGGTKPVIETLELAHSGFLHDESGGGR
jgi:phage tail-like protein